MANGKSGVSMSENIIINQNQSIILPVLWLGDEDELTYDIKLAGKGASITLLILLLGKETNKLALRTNIYHQQPQTTSKIIVKGALDGSAMVNFDGLVKIEPGAIGTNAWLAAHLLLLSDKASGRAVPSLEILENDIKAGHATTVGRVNDLEMFYLQSRGLSEKAAKALIIQGFLTSMLSEFPIKIAEKAAKELELYVQ
jgi:Fe-S cluster assembly scaffold protein SufB